MKIYIVLTVSILFLISCTTPAKESGAEKPEIDYWSSGLAEISRYELHQVQYGEIHKGDAILLFVTEPFDRVNQVKWEGKTDKSNAVQVLKLNAIRNYNTGIYPYSVMTSVFQPMDLNNYPRAMKITGSFQEWCGHVFSQLGILDQGYQFQHHSYFQFVGEQDRVIQGQVTEDQLWVQLRLDPSSLPVGKVSLIPSLFSSRMSHRHLKAETAMISHDQEKGRVVIHYVDFSRSVTLNYSPEFPYEILSWEETQKSGTGKNARDMTTRAVKTNQVQSYYWEQNRNQHRPLREQLGLKAH